MMAIIVSSSLFDNIDLSIAETVVFGGFIIFFFFFIRSIYRVYFHPLSHVPGPLLAKSTSLWLAWSNYKGDHHLTVHGLHHRYGTVVRLAPWEVSIADGAAQTAIYSQRRGFNKSSWYQNFDVDGHETIFSATSPTRRDRSAKAVLPLFSAQNIQHNASDIIDHAAATLARRVKAQAARQKEVDLLPLARAFAMDIMATYLFHHSPKTFDEDTGKLSVSGYITALAAASRFWYVPKRAFFALCAVADFFAEPETHRSTQAMKAYVAGVMANITPGDRSFQGLLADAGLSRSQIKAQCQDSFYAGVDPTYFSLASICHLLASNPDKYELLCEAVQRNDASPSPLKPSELPYVTAIAKEGLRLAVPLPGRLPRSVPPTGYTFDGYALPSGTSVGVPMYEIHLNPSTFPEPTEFLPERWIETKSREATEAMKRDWAPFGKGSRACIARHMAMVEIYAALEHLGRTRVLEGARPKRKELDVMGWFNALIASDRVELVWER
ncbi:MAG: hypothetical protein LQ342_007002 [Letrouitia transgressa]|nr:MAG: hypothetical protein LQ342_007002 [Letrouitia transgressa]